MAVLCVAGSTYTLEFSLEDQGNAGLWKADPTIAAGDFQISVNGGAFENVDNIPTVAPAVGRRLALVISAAETTAAGAGGLIYIRGVDAAGSEWYDIAFSVRVSARDVDDHAFPNTAGHGMDVDVSGGVEVGSFQTDALDADALKADAVTEIQEGIDADVWSHATRTLTQSAASVAAALAGSTITILRGDTLNVSLTGLGDISGRSKLWFTVKTKNSQADSEAAIMIEETAGLLYLNGAAAGTPANGDITVNDEVAGDITITLEAAETDDLPPGSGLAYDVQMLTSGGDVQTLTSGACVIPADTTRAVS